MSWKSICFQDWKRQKNFHKIKFYPSMNRMSSMCIGCSTQYTFKFIVASQMKQFALLVYTIIRNKRRIMNQLNIDTMLPVVYSIGYRRENFTNWARQGERWMNKNFVLLNKMLTECYDTSGTLIFLTAFVGLDTDRFG